MYHAQSCLHEHFSLSPSIHIYIYIYIYTLITIFYINNLTNSFNNLFLTIFLFDLILLVIHKI
ncbi:hypothetical protein K6L59_02935 [Candidatus Phytoplasma sp. Tabriz.2]|nr:hypothetical protein [Candidatus Phytoplasma australiense]